MDYDTSNDVRNSIESQDRDMRAYEKENIVGREGNAIGGYYKPMSEVLKDAKKVIYVPNGEDDFDVEEIH